jgi:hypothetical protein
MNIEITIDSSISFVKKQGIKIVTDFWGIRNVEDKWVSLNNMCCPLGAVLLEHQKIFLESQLFKGAQANIDLRDVRFNPAHSIINLFHVDIAWVNSFSHGLVDSKIRYYKYQSVRDLGYKYHQIYRANDI